MATPKEVAEWMVEQLEAHGELQQADAVAGIEERFGSEFVYVADCGLPSIDRRVLYQFNKLTGDDVVWQTYHRNWYEGYWRYREPGDSQGRTQRD